MKHRFTCLLPVRPFLYRYIGAWGLALIALVLVWDQNAIVEVCTALGQGEIY